MGSKAIAGIRLATRTATANIYGRMCCLQHLHSCSILLTAPVTPLWKDRADTAIIALACLCWSEECINRLAVLPIDGVRTTGLC